MKQFIFCLITIMSVHFSAAAQNFKVAVAKASGDLNKDGIEDLVTVIQDTLHENAPYRLQVSFGKGYGKFTPIVSSDQLIEPQYPDGREGYMYGNGFDSVEIKKGILMVNISLLRGYIIYKFRYQNGNFELIGYKSSSSDGIGTIYSDDFNLSAGDRITIRENYETGKIISNEKTKKLVRPLPKLQDIKAFEEEW